MKRATGNRTRIIFTLMGVTVFGIWLTLLVIGELSILGHLAFLGAAAWMFELYSAAQRENLKRPDRPSGSSMEERLHEFEEEHNL
jgi:hypothetical protein